MTVPPDIAVAIATYNRAGLLGDLLAALEAQTLPAERFEVVLVDNGSRDDTPAVVANLLQTTSLTVRVVTLAENRGPARGRNAAWRAASAPVVAFTDDDCRPTPTWLERGLAAMEEGHYVCVGQTRPVQEEWKRRGPFSTSLWVTNPSQFETANVFYRRDDLAAVGGFDETFRYPGGEDLDLGMRVVARGAAARYVPDALVHHAVHRSDFRAALSRALRWSDLPLVVKRHPSTRRNYVMRFFWRRAHPRVLLLLGGLFVAAAARRPAALALGMPWITYRAVTAPVLPQGRRRYALLPAVFVLDAAEVAALIRGSIRHRTLFL